MMYSEERAGECFQASVSLDPGGSKRNKFKGHWGLSVYERQLNELGVRGTSMVRRLEAVQSGLKVGICYRTKTTAVSRNRWHSSYDKQMIAS